MQRGSELLIWTGMVSLLTAALPLFLCLPLWADATHYDLCARNLLRGGVLYRDLFDMNLPGMVWLHAAVRSLAGWRSETLRTADMLVVTAVAALLFHHQEIRHTLQTSRQRYVVSDLFAAGMTPAQVAADAPDACTLPPDFPAALRNVFPWSQPVVFRAGRFVVHGVRGTVRALTSNSGEFGYE